MLKNSPFNMRGTFPILQNMLVQNNTATCTNLDIFLSYPVEYEGVPILVPLDTIKAALKISKTPEITAEGVIADGVVIKFQSADVDDFPDAPEIVNPVKLTVPGFADAVKKIKYAMAKQDVRYYLNGFLLEVEKEKVRVVATDGHRLHFIDLEDAPEGTPNISAIFPGECAKLIASDDLAIGTNNVKVGEHLVVKLVDGKYPDYRRILPVHKNKVTFSKAELLKFCQTVMKLGKQNFYEMILDIEEGGTKLDYHFRKVVGEDKTREKVLEGSTADVKVEGPSLEIGINVPLMVDALKSFSEDEVTLAYGESNSSVFINGEVVVMPFRL